MPFLHEVALQGYAALFETITYPLQGIAADDSYILQWIRNQFLVWNYIFLLLVSNWVFLFAQIFYNDGKMIVPFWNQLMQTMPFL